MTNINIWLICITFAVISGIILGTLLKLKKQLETDQLKVLNHLQEVLKQLKEVIEHNRDIIDFNKKLSNVLMNDINFITANIKIIKNKIEKI